LERTSVPVTLANGARVELRDGSVVIAAITSCTNTSNPSVMLAAGLLARNAVQRGLSPAPWVKTSLAPGSLVVTDYLRAARLSDPLAALGFHLVGYGCTTCIGNSGPLEPAVSEAIDAHELSAVAVLSGNRNFEGRIHPDCRMNFLASPPLVVAYALAGTVDIDLRTEPLGRDRDERAVYLRDLWPSSEEIARAAEAVETGMYRERYATVLDGDERWRALRAPTGERYAWDPASTYIRRPPFFEGVTRDVAALRDIAGARVLVMLGDSVTTDHISPAGVIRRDGPAGRWLLDHGVQPADFNTYGSRRGNHEVMVRGTFANLRLRNQLVPGTEGGVTVHLPSGEQMSIYDAAKRYAAEQVPLVVLAGHEYGSGSSRDWAAKGSQLLGIRAVIAQGFERIHRSNLIGMGVLPVQFAAGDSIVSLGLTGHEELDIIGVASLTDDGPFPRPLRVRVRRRDDTFEFDAIARIDTASECDVFLHGGILPYTLRRLA
jgi:aconitate hydratase